MKFKHFKKKEIILFRQWKKQSKKQTDNIQLWLDSLKFNESPGPGKKMKTIKKTSHIFLNQNRKTGMS